MSVRNRKEMFGFGNSPLPYPLIHASYALGALMAFIGPELAVTVGFVAFLGSVAGSFAYATRRNEDQ